MYSQEYYLRRYSILEGLGWESEREVCATACVKVTGAEPGGVSGSPALSLPPNWSLPKDQHIPVCFFTSQA